MLYYYLVEVNILYSDYRDNHSITRLVVARDKNEAYDKVRVYLREVYCSDSGAKFEILVKDTIL